MVVVDLHVKGLYFLNSIGPIMQTHAQGQVLRSSIFLDQSRCVNARPDSNPYSEQRHPNAQRREDNVKGQRQGHL
jgi:hypothetical protein